MEASKVRRLELRVTPELAGIKVDTLLKKHMGLSGTVVRRIKWLEDGILADGRRVTTRYCPQDGEVLSVRLSDEQRRSGIVPHPGPLDIVYEDGDMIVLNKSAGVSVHPGPGHFCDTIGWIITILRGNCRISTLFTAWTGGPQVCWWRPSTPTLRRC